MHLWMSITRGRGIHGDAWLGQSLGAFPRALPAQGLHHCAQGLHRMLPPYLPSTDSPALGHPWADPWGQHGITLLRDKDLWYVLLRILEQIQVGHVLYTIWTSISEEREILLAWNSCLRFVFSSHRAYVWIKPDSGSLGCENFLKTSSWVWTTECHTVYPNYDYFAIKRHCIWAIGTNEMQSLQGIVRTL